MGRNRHARRDRTRRYDRSPGGLANLLGVPGAKLHVYGKRSVRPGRKMGHVTFLSEKPGEAWARALALRRALAGPELPETAPQKRL
ncbi:MAG: hypothetical protein AABZ22_09935 [Nitrospirota bacterium]